MASWLCQTSLLNSHPHTHARTHTRTLALKVLVSVVFVVEVVGLAIFHLVNTNQHSLFLRNPYYWYLIILAGGGLVASLPLPNFYSPLCAGNGLAVFQVCPSHTHTHTHTHTHSHTHLSLQAARLPRLIRAHKNIRNFFFKIVGDGTKLLAIITLTGIFLMFFAVINMQLFGYIDPNPQCKNFGNGHFDNFFLVYTHIRTILIEVYSV